MNTVLKPIFQQTVGLLSGYRAKNKLLILTYHRVLENYDPIIDEVDAVQFTQQMETLAEFFNVLSLDEGLERMQNNDLPPGSVCVTFDDGYRDNHDVALPILNALNLPATFFVATGYLGDGMMWNDVITESVRKTTLREVDLADFSLGKFSILNDHQRVNLIDMLQEKWKYCSVDERNQIVGRFRQVMQVEFNERLMMTEDEVKALSLAGMEIGGHTVSHPILACTDLDEVRQEISQGKQKLESIVGKELKFFAYPNGQFGKDYTKEHAQLVESLGFKAALTTNNGVIDNSSELYELPRISIDYANKFRFGVSLARGYVQFAN